MINVTIDCNAITYNNIDEETVKWLVEDYYCNVGVRKRIYSYSVEAIAKHSNTTIIFECRITSDVVIKFIDDFATTIKKPTVIVIDNAPIHTP